MTFLGGLRALVMAPGAAVVILLTGPSKARYKRLGSVLTLAAMAMAIHTLRAAEKVLSR